ncbi:MAG TPA: tetratricopeptide repeat protein [Desulfobacterales bacterium]|nr:tetratricopeptide repeat protein [Desulfobacterales bacterium]
MKRLLIALLCFSLSLLADRRADSQGTAMIHEVLTKSEKMGASIVVKLSGAPAYKVIGLGKNEILIALKDTEFSRAIHNKQVTGDGLIQRVELEDKPDNVSCLLVKLRKPYIKIDHEIEAGTGRLRVQITGEGSSSKGESERSEAPARSAQGRPSPPPAPRGSAKADGLPDTPAPMTLTRPGGIAQLLKPNFKGTTPDPDLYREAAECFKEGRWEETILILSEIISVYPESPHLEQPYFLLAASYDRMFHANSGEHFVEVMQHYQYAINKFPDSVFLPQAMVSVGNRYMKEENYHEALAYYGLVCENYRGYAAAPEAILNRGKIFALTKKPQEAIKEFQQVETHYPETPFAGVARIERAKALFDMNNFKRSLGMLDEIMNAEPARVYENPDILLYSGHNYYELGELEKSREALCEVLNYYPHIESNDLILARIADTYREQGMEDKAFKLYSMVLRRYPNSQGGLISMLRLSDNIKKVGLQELLSPGVIEEITYNRPASETYKEIMRAHGGSPLSQLAGLRLALEQQKDKNHEGSIGTLREMLTKYPDTALKEQIKSALRASVKAILEKEQQAGNYARIAGYYEEIKADLGVEDMGDIFLILGDAYRRLHLYNRAIFAFKEARKSYTDQAQRPTLLFGLGVSLHKTKSFEEAHTALEAYVFRYPDERQAYHAYFLIGDIMLRQKAYEKAMAALKLAIKKDPDAPYKIEILLAMAEASNALRHHDSASTLLNRAIALMNQNKTDFHTRTYDAYWQLAETYLRLGENQRAVSALEKALKVSPKGRNDCSLRFRIAECYQRLREEDKTEGILNQIIASEDPFWSTMAAAKVNEIETDIRIQDYYSSLNS